MLSKLTKAPLGLITTIMLDFHRGGSTNGIYNHLVKMLLLDTNALLDTFEFEAQCSGMLKKTPSTISFVCVVLFNCSVNKMAFWVRRGDTLTPF